MNEQLKIIISAEIDKAKKALDEAQKEIQNTGNKAKEASKEVESFTEKFNKQSKELKDLKSKYVDIVAKYGENSKEAKECAK